MLAYVAAFAFTNKTRDIDFSTWFCEREERRTEPDLDVLSVHLLREVVDRLFQICEANVAVYIQTFDLMEEAVRARRDGFIAINPSGHDGADRRLLLLHQADPDRKSTRLN